MEQQRKKVTVPDLGRMKAAGERISMVTAYDCAFARLLDEAGVDMLLVGDSLGMVVQGNETTLPVTLDEMVYHTRLVSRGAPHALVVVTIRRRANASRARITASPASITFSTPQRRMRWPVKNDGPNMPTMCEEMIIAAALYGWPQTRIAIGVDTMRKFMTP